MFFRRITKNALNENPDFPWRAFLWSAMNRLITCHAYNGSILVLRRSFVTVVFIIIVAWQLAGIAQSGGYPHSWENPFLERKPGNREGN